MEKNTLKTVRQFSEAHPAFTQASLRALIFKSEPVYGHGGELLPGNGLIEFGAIIRLGRRVLIDEEKFFAWVRAQQGERT